jgi:hypothetical protein
MNEPRNPFKVGDWVQGIDPDFDLNGKYFKVLRRDTHMIWVYYPHDNKEGGWMWWRFKLSETHEVEKLLKEYE